MTGKDGVSVVDAEIAIDDHLVLKLSNGNIIDAGELPKAGKASNSIFVTGSSVQWTSDELRLITPSGEEVSLALGNRTITASESAVLIDNGKLIKANHAATPIVITIDNDATIGWSANEILTAWQQGAAAVSFAAGAGVTLRSPASIGASEQYGTIAAMRVGANEWTLL